MTGKQTDLSLTEDQLRGMSPAELACLGEQSLESHLLGIAETGHRRHQALAGNGLYSFLSDPEMVRYPTRLVFEMGTMATHQFGQPEPDPASINPAFLLYLHPDLESRPTDLRFAVPFFIPSINYGKGVPEELGLLFGATIHGMTIRQFYDALCTIADSIGARPCLQGHTHQLV